MDNLFLRVETLLRETKSTLVKMPMGVVDNSLALFNNKMDLLVVLLNRASAEISLSKITQATLIKVHQVTKDLSTVIEEILKVDNEKDMNMFLKLPKVRSLLIMVQAQLMWVSQMSRMYVPIDNINTDSMQVTCLESINTVDINSIEGTTEEKKKKKHKKDKKDKKSRNKIQSVVVAEALKEIQANIPNKELYPDLDKIKENQIGITFPQDENDAEKYKETETATATAPSMEDIGEDSEEENTLRHRHDEFEKEIMKETISESENEQNEGKWKEDKVKKIKKKSIFGGNPFSKKHRKVTPTSSLETIDHTTSVESLLEG